MSGKEIVWQRTSRPPFEPFGNVTDKDKSHIERYFQTSFQVRLGKGESLLKEFNQAQNTDRKIILKFYLPNGITEEAEIVAISLIKLDLNQVLQGTPADTIKVVVPLTNEQIARVSPDNRHLPTFGY